MDGLRGRATGATTEPPCGFHGFIANQIEIATMAATIAAHAIGTTRFELPLRGESLAAWLNSRFI
jgi:hypothetical protein